MKLEIPSQNDTEVYASDVGYVCIKQPNPWGEDSLIIMAIDNVDILCQMIQVAKSDAIKNRNEYLNGRDEE
jgi:hypothetical protein